MTKQPKKTKDMQIAELTDDLKRIQAEFINYKSRVEQEKTQITDYSAAATIKELLPLIDDLERALAHIPAELSTNPWAQGVKKVYDRLTSQLIKLGVQVIDPVGQHFDPELHEAVSVEGDGPLQIVAAVHQKGYEYKSRVIRHAVVAVQASSLADSESSDKI